MKKILFVVTRCIKSGPINQLFNLVSYLYEKKYDLYLITLYEEPLNNSLLEKFKKYTKHINVLTKKRSLLISSCENLRKEIDFINPDIIHSLGVFPDFFLEKYYSQKHVFVCRNFVTDDYPNQYGWILGNILAKIHLHAIKKSKHCICCSESLSILYKQKYGIELPFIRNGVNINEYTSVDYHKKIELREKLDLPICAKIFVYGGVFNLRKNQSFVINNINANRELLNKNIVFLLLGDGQLLNKLRNKNKCTNILMPGNKMNMIDYLQASDFYFSTSKSEGLPNGVLEALSCGLPCLLSNIPQHMEILKQSTIFGNYYEQDSSDDFFQKINEMMQKDYDNNEIREEAKRLFSSEVTCKSFENLYFEILRKENDDE